MRIFLFLVLSLDTFAHEMESLENAKRYDHITTLSLYQLTRPDCGSTCRKVSGLNAMRGSILMGDNNGAALIADKFLDSQSRSEVRILLTYVYALQANNQSLKENFEKLTPDDQNRILRLLTLDAPYVLKELPPQKDVFLKIDATEKKLWTEYNDAPRKSPWVAGISNLVIPGSGYAYLGMWQSAGINFILTGICVFSAVELFKNNLPASGVAVSMVGSVFYVGGALGAARSANDINQKNLKHISEPLRNILLPELRFEF